MTEAPPMAPPSEEKGSQPSQTPPHDLSHQAHRQLIGYLGIGLPAILLVLAALRPTDGLPRWPPLDSVSAYYYTGAVGIFVGILFALALFLFTYGGYKKYLADRVVGKIGGVCALGVALFPTAAPPGLSEPSWWSDTTMVIHYISAASLFVVFILFALWLFRKTEVPKGQELGKGKRRRNNIYLGCGLVMVACVLWAGSSYFTHAPIFLPEIIALMAFAVSWLVKGYAHRPVVEAVKKVFAR